MDVMALKRDLVSYYATSLVMGFAYCYSIAIWPDVSVNLSKDFLRSPFAVFPMCLHKSP